MQNPLVAVIIVNYNGYELTRECLRSFNEVTYNRYVLIVVDNASWDDPVPRLRQEFPHVLFVQSETNLGFTGGNNLGLVIAYEADADYVFFLNNDTVVSKDIFNLASFLSEHPDVGMVAPLTFYYDNPGITSFGGGHLDRNTGRIIFINNGFTREEITDSVYYCSFLSGAAIMARAELVKSAGGFNDDYFLTSEESELCVKVADLGYRLALITSCSVWHKVSQTMRPGSEMITYFIYRNRLVFIKNNAVRLGLREVAVILHNYASSFLSFAFKLRNVCAARGLFWGVLDFWRGVRGVGRYRRLLQPERQRQIIIPSK